MSKVPLSAVTSVVEAVLRLKIHRATKYISPTMVVRATVGKRDMNSKTLVLTIGKPNFLERKFVKTLIKAKEPFPVKNVIFKYPPVPRIKKAKKKK
jgi:hypothetical protein